MKKSIVIAILMILAFLPFTSAFVGTPNLVLNKTDLGSIVIAELNNPAIYNFDITNNGPKDVYELYSYVGLTFDPEEKFVLESGKSNMNVYAYPSQELRNKPGTYNIEYQLIGEDSGILKDLLPMKIVSLKDAVKIRVNNVHYLDETATIEILNMENINLKNVKIRFKSILFDETQVFSLNAYERKTIQLVINNLEVKTIAAGAYVVTNTIEYNDAVVKVDETFNYLEKEGSSIVKETSGLLLRASKLTKKNEGNTMLQSDKIEVTKNVFTRLFTTFSETPMGTEREGLTVRFTWAKDLEPSESWSVTVTTNYTLPFFILIFIIFIAIMVYIYGRTALVMEKRVSFVKTSTGDFALKVRIHAKARRTIENIEISDRVPHAMKIYEKGGMPHRLDVPNRKMIWEVDKLNAGEERIFSYIIYSNINVVGRYELPAAAAKFTKDNKNMYVHSNRTFFMSDIHSGQ